MTSKVGWLKFAIQAETISEKKNESRVEENNVWERSVEIMR